MWSQKACESQSQIRTRTNYLALFGWMKKSRLVVVSWGQDRIINSSVVRRPVDCLFSLSLSLALFHSLPPLSCMSFPSVFYKYKYIIWYGHGRSSRPTCTAPLLLVTVTCVSLKLLYRSCTRLHYRTLRGERFSGYTLYLYIISRLFEANEGGIALLRIRGWAQGSVG